VTCRRKNAVVSVLFFGAGVDGVDVDLPARAPHVKRFL
jgi:hypothetical protein